MPPGWTRQKSTSPSSSAKSSARTTSPAWTRSATTSPHSRSATTPSPGRSAGSSPAPTSTTCCTASTPTTRPSPTPWLPDRYPRRTYGRDHLEPVDKASGGLLILSGWRGAAFAAPSPDRGRAGLVPGEPAGHDHYCGPVDHGLVMFDPAFVVADQAPVAHQPAEGALDDPPAADDLETGQVAALDDLQRDAGGLPDPGGQWLAVIAAVGPHDLQRREHLQQPGDQQLRAGPVADLGAGDHDRQQPALDIDGGVPAPPVDLLPAMEPAAAVPDGDRRPCRAGSRRSPPW